MGVSTDGDEDVTAPATAPATAPVPRLRALVAAGVALALSSALQASFSQVVGSDGLFHIAQAERVLGGGMPWMPYSVFAEGWVDHQLGFHLLLWPLASVLPGVVAAKIGAALFAAVALFSVWAFATRARMPAPWAIALLPIATSWLLWLRLEMPRTQALSLVLLLGTLWALREGRVRALVVLSFCFAWTYHVSLIVLPVAAWWALLAGLRTRSWRPALLPGAAAAGLALGWTVHPHSPRTWSFLYQHVILKVLNEDALPVGLEWTDGGVGALAQHGWGAVAALLLAGVALKRAPKVQTDTIALLGLAVAATLAVGVGTKFVEYALPLAFLAAGAAARDAAGTARPALLRGLAAVCALGVLFSAHTVREAVQGTEPDPHRLEPALDAVRGVATPGDIVYHFSWNDFPELVLHGPEFRYIVGLDPHFLALHDPERWRLYEAMGGAFGPDRSRHIRDTFDARWALLVLPYAGARDALKSDPGLTVVWANPDAVLYEVNPPE